MKATHIVIFDMPISYNGIQIDPGAKFDASEWDPVDLEAALSSHLIAELKEQQDETFGKEHVAESERLNTNSEDVDRKVKHGDTEHSSGGD